MRYFYLLLPILLALSACDTKTQTESVDSLKSSLGELKKTIDTYTPSTKGVTEMTASEIAKLFTIEYKVISLSKDLSPEKVQVMLDTAGRDRWDCFSTQQTDSALQIFCKRLPETYLRYLPKLLF